MKHKLEFLNEESKVISYNGYAFLDRFGFCIIIIYGEKRRDLTHEILNNN